ncbi:MAG: hypothetical protein WCZ23_05855 [Rhodospirillaceae bacterium]
MAPMDGTAAPSAPAAAPSGAEEPTTVRSEDLAFSMDFLPVLDGRESRVNTLYCRPTARLPDGTFLSDDTLLSSGMAGRTVNDALLIKMMLRTLEMAGVRAALMAKTGDTRKIIIPVNGAALAIPAVAAAFADGCRTFIRDLSQSILFEVTNMDDEKSMGYLDEVAILLYPFCLTYSARILPKTQNFKLYATTNYSGIALHLRDKPWPMKAVGSYFDDLVKRSEANRLKAYCHGLGSVELVEAALAAGVRFVSGPGVKGWLAQHAA